MPKRNALEIKQLKKFYPNGFPALKGIDLTVKANDFFGLLGPNGAGKSTTIGIISSLITKTEGTVKVFGHDLDSDQQNVKRHLGIVPQEFNFSIFETPMQILVNQAGYYGVPFRVANTRAKELLELMGLWEKRNSMAGGLSGGQKRRLMIARALVHEPKLLILDEPTAGVDISLRRLMWDLLQKLNKDGLTIILTTHYLEEAEALCKNIGIIDNGQIIQNTTKKELLSLLPSESFIIETTKKLPKTISLSCTQHQTLSDNSIEVQLNTEQNLNDLVLELNKQDIIVKRLSAKANRLEEVFLQLVEDPK